MQLRDNGYSYSWRSPGWVAGPIFLFGGVALVAAGMGPMNGNLPVSAVGGVCALGGAYLTSLLEGFDYAPLKREFTSWSSRMGFRRARPPVKIKEGSWILLSEAVGGTVQLQLHGEGTPPVLLMESRPDRAADIARSMAKALKLEFRETPPDTAS